MEKFILTTEIMDKARDYMPLADKVELATYIAEHCIEKQPTATQNKAKDLVIDLPYLRQENMALKQLMLMHTLLTYYLQIDVNEPFGYEDYDYYASSHILNQLERQKGNVAYKDKAFDLITDYKDFKKVLDTILFNVKTSNNDPLERFVATIELVAKPENLKELKGQLEKLTTEYNDTLIARRNEIKSKDKQLDEESE